MDHTTAMPSCVSSLHHAPQLLAAHRIDADAGFVEQQHLGLAISAQASPSFCFMPPDSLPARRSHERLEPRELQQLPKTWCRARRPCSPRSRAYSCRFSMHRQFFVQAESLRHVAGTVVHVASRTRRRRGRRADDAPSVGVISAAISRINVVLPAPSGPTSPVRRPASMSCRYALQRLDVAEAS